MHLDTNLKTNNKKTNYMSFCVPQNDNEIRPAVVVNDSLLEEVDSLPLLLRDELGLKSDLGRAC